MKLLSAVRAVCVVLGLLSLAGLSAASQSRTRVSADGWAGLAADLPGRWTSAQVAAPDSVEGQLRSEGIVLGSDRGEIGVGVYVQDILEGRLDQPEGPRRDRGGRVNRDSG